jgi:hypothetical protein
MQRPFSAAIALALSLLLVPAAIAETAQHRSTTSHKRVVHKHLAHKRRHVARHWHGYGFLPGYVPPEVAERERAWRYWQREPHFLRPAWPRFYRGRWNGGGFGSCYVYTPIGYMWTCGK